VAALSLPRSAYGSRSAFLRSGTTLRSVPDLVRLPAFFGASTRVLAGGRGSVGSWGRVVRASASPSAGRSPTFRHCAPLRAGPRTSSRWRWWWRRVGRGPTSLRSSGGGVVLPPVVLHACVGWWLR